MQSHQSQSIWLPFLLLVALLVLCFFAPRVWQSPQQPSQETTPLAFQQPRDEFRQESPTATVTKRVSSQQPVPISDCPLIQSTPIEPVVIMAPELAPTTSTLAVHPLLHPHAPVVPPVAQRRTLEPGIGLVVAAPPASIPVDHDSMIMVSRHGSGYKAPVTTRVRSIERNGVQMISYQDGNTKGIWPRPRGLLDQLTSISNHATTQPWVDDVELALEQLLNYENLEDSRIPRTLNQLDGLVKTGNRQAERLKDLEVRSQWLRTVYALNRRLTIWKSIQHLVNRNHRISPAADASTVRLVRQLETFDRDMRSLSGGQSWVDYFLVRQLLETASTHTSESSSALCNLACRVLNRMTSPLLDELQQEFVTTPPVQSLQQALRKIITHQIHPLELLRELERYETQPTTQVGATLASRYQFLRWSLDEDERALASQLDNHYRNANIRIAISQALINRMLPAPKALEEPIDDTILGARVSGKSRTSTMLKVFLIPDKKQWRLGVQASGEVTSDTETRKRSNTFHNKGSSRYTVNKDLMVDRRGVRLGHATAKAEDIESELLKFETGFDSLPLFGSMFRSIVRNQYNLQSDQARDIFENRVSRRARSRFDEEIAGHLSQVENRFQDRYLTPLKNLQLEPIALDLQTTTGSRLILRYRLAGNRQMAANTSRPRAPGDSLMSIQIHESAINNTLQNLKLDGKQTDLRTLYRDIAKAFDRSDITIPEEIPTNVTVSMADQESVRVQFGDGTVRLRIHMKELKSGSRHKWKNFVLTAKYQPSKDQLTASLYRDGHLQFAGKHLRLKDRIALQGIFNKALPRTQPVNIINQGMADQPGLKDLEVSQFIVRNTWIGVALSLGENASTGVAERRKDRRNTLAR